MNRQWTQINKPPPENGFYIVELQTCDIPDMTEIRVDFYKDDYWGCGQFLNKWSVIDDWVESEIKPPENLGVLVFIPDEDDHITAGMWDVSEKWVLLDEYRIPDSQVTHWRFLPDKPNTKS